MKNMLMRPTAALFPAVLLLGALFGKINMAVYLFLYWMALQFCSLCSVDAFRNAAAREPGVRRVDRRFSGTWPMILIGMAAMAAIDCYMRGEISFRHDGIWMIAAAGCITIEQLFEERMFALSRRTDGVVLSVISSVLLLAGLMLDSSGGVAAPVDTAWFYTVCCAGLGALISIMASYGVEPMRAFSLIPRNIGFFPKAAVQCLLYPAAAIALLTVITSLEMPLIDEGRDLQFIFGGLMIWRLSRTVCRRTADESRKLNLLLTAACAAAAGGCFVEEIAGYGVFSLAALVCVLMVFCAPGWRIYAAAALLAGANAMVIHPVLQGDMHIAAVIACCVLAVVLNMHKAFLRKV